MKTLILCISLVLLFTFSFAQTPQAIPFQSVARNAAGDALVNQNISVRFTIRDNSYVGPELFKERHNVITNSLGVFSLNIGEGQLLAGNFSTINWALQLKFLQIEMDATGGSNFIDMGTQQMLSVPYSLYSQKSGSAPGTIASSAIMHGLLPPLTDGNNFQFMGNTISAVITAGQKVEVTGTCVLGTTAVGGATMPFLSLGKKKSTDAIPSDNFGDYIQGTTMVQNMRIPLTMNTIFLALPAGTYEFGIIYQCATGQAVNWNSNNWYRVSVKVINP